MHRQGRGRSGKMYFPRGEVVELVFGYCQMCGNGYRRKNLKQKFCGVRCRKQHHYWQGVRKRTGKVPIRKGRLKPATIEDLAAVTLDIEEIPL